MINGKIESKDFGSIIELVEGTALVTSFDASYYKINKSIPKPDQMVVARPIHAGDIEVFFLRDEYSFREIGTRRNNRPIVQYLGPKSYILYDIEEGYSGIARELEKAGLL
jgi:hypothetical protein